VSDPRRAAAVVLAIFAQPQHGVIFVQRAAHLRHHPGQIGLPGGSLDPADENDLRRAALREMEEEVGVTSDRVTLVGELPLVSPRVNLFDITPFVAVIAPGELRIDGTETAGVFTVPLDTIVNGGLHDGTVTIGTLDIATPVLDYEGHRIWGVTGRILQNFIEAYHTPGNALRKRIEENLIV
jgi:ADP-ribose pyrophosphatase YjhB (NUDIX family)